MPWFFSLSFATFRQKRKTERDLNLPLGQVPSPMCNSPAGSHPHEISQYWLWPQMAHFKLLHLPVDRKLKLTHPEKTKCRFLRSRPPHSQRVDLLIIFPTILQGKKLSFNCENDLSHKRIPYFRRTN